MTNARLYGLFCNAAEYFIHCRCGIVVWYVVFLTLGAHAQRELQYLGLCVCLSVKSHLTYGACVCPENAVTYLTGNEGRKICGVFSENAPLLRSSGVTVVFHTFRWPFFFIYSKSGPHTYYHLVFTVMLAEPQGNTQLAAGVQGAHSYIRSGRVCARHGRRVCTSVLRAYFILCTQ